MIVVAASTGGEPQGDGEGGQEEEEAEERGG